MTDPKKMGVMQTKATVKPFKSSKKAWVAVKDGVVYLYAKEKVRLLFHTVPLGSCTDDRLCTCGCRTSKKAYQRWHSTC
jgi:hypothetical protein